MAPGTTVAPPNLMFVTSTTYRGDFGGLEAADARCRERAQAANLKGTFVALLSTSTVDARTRLGAARGWVRTDGRPFADTQDDLFSGRIFWPPRLDEFSRPVPAFPSDGVVPQPFSVAFTGSLADGRVMSGKTGEDWTLPPGIDLSRDVSSWNCAIGYPEAGGTSWLSMGSGGCDLQQRLYCLATDNNSRVGIPPPSRARVAFLTRGPFDPASGLERADHLCAAEAKEACLPGSFKALLANGSASALSRFDLAGAPWVRPDGVFIVEKASDLANGELLAPLDVSADGRDRLYVGVWTGASHPTSPARVNCADWTSRTASGHFTDSVYSGRAWFFREPLRSCRDPASVYCLQE